MKRVLLVCMGLWTLFAPVAVAGSLMVAGAAAADPQCQSGRIIAFGTRRWCGYFNNEFNTGGLDVRNGGVPGSVNSASEFITMVTNDLNSSNQHRKTAAQFVILTMIGRGSGQPQSVSGAQLQDWKDRVNSYASGSENGSQSFGPNGRIDWFVSMHTPCGIPNTYYQVAENDVAPFLDEPGNSNCNVPSYKTNFILFRDTSGTVQYMIRRECMNPMGDLDGLDKAPNNYNLQPSVVTEINGDTSTTAAEVGDTVRFTYRVTNSGSDPSSSADCTIYANVHSGYFPTPSMPTSGNDPPGYSPPPDNCPKSFNPGLSQVATENVTVSTPNQTICRSLFVNPASPDTASRGTEVCVPVANKPYVRVFGGDVSAGNGLATSSGVCTNNTDAAILSWNKRGGGDYAGAGSQYAVYALSAIRDFATALGNPGGAAQPPSGLAFTNTSTNPGSGVFGGSFDVMPCIPDHYATQPGTAQLLPPTFNDMTTGNYAASGSVTLSGGVVDRGEQIALFVDGDVFISSNITYASGTWSLEEMPSFRLVVRGNVYVSRDVTQLDGLYVAQREGSSGGNLYTCATGFSALPLDGSLYSTCLNKLTVNGAIVADRLHLLRTTGSLSQSTANESNAASPAGEIFNFGPSLWLKQPVLENASTPDYDAIISLPPIL